MQATPQPEESGEAPPPTSSLHNQWFMLAALLTVVAAAGQGDGGERKQPPRRSNQTLLARPAKTAATTKPRHPRPGLYACNEKHTRRIASDTDLRFLNIPGAMADALFPDILAYQITQPGRKKAFVRLGGKGRPVFASQVLLIDENSRGWPVLFRTYATGTQYHRRLTDGWRPFASGHAVSIGDSVMLWREVGDERPGSLVMRVFVERGRGGCEAEREYEAR